MAGRRQTTGPASTARRASTVPADLRVCYVEDWIEPGSVDFLGAPDPCAQQVGGMSPGVSAGMQSAQLAAWRRWKDARRVYAAAHGIPPGSVRQTMGESGVALRFRDVARFASAISKRQGVTR